MTSADFIREQGDKPAREIQVAASKQGLNISPTYTYKVRSRDKKRGCGPTPRKSAHAAGGQLTKDEITWLNLSFRLGTTKIEKLHSFYQATLSSLLV
jgi:hypothetical protein